MKGLLVTYFLCYGGAVAALFDPFVGLLVYVCFSILKPEAIWPWSVPPGNYSRTVALALLAGWVVQGFGNWRFGRGRPVVAALIGFWVWSALGAAQAPNQTVAWGFVDALTKIVLPFLVGITTVHSVRQLKQLAWVILLSQGYVAYEVNLSYIQGYNFLREAGFAGLDNNSAAIALVTCVGLGFFLGLTAARLWQRVLALGTTALLVHAVLLSFSRGGMLALIVTGVVSFLMIPKRPLYCAVFAAAVLLGVRLAGPEVVARFSTVAASEGTRDASAQGRLDLWKDCLDAIGKRPLFGAGPDHWPLIVEEYGWPPGKEAHTLWLQTGAELGVPGLFLLASFYGLCAARLRPLLGSRAEPDDPWFGDAARMVIASLAGFIIAAQFVSLETLEVPYYVALLGAGVLKLSSASQEPCWHALEVSAVS